MLDRARPVRNRSSSAHRVNTLVVEDGLSTWGPPTVAMLGLGTGVLLDALGTISEQVAAPLHLDHLSTTHEIDSPGGTRRLDEVTRAGVPNATLTASFYRHRVPGALWLLSGGCS